jgi:hypothetical protein
MMLSQTDPSGARVPNFKVRPPFSPALRGSAAKTIKAVNAKTNFFDRWNIPTFLFEKFMGVGIVPFSLNALYEE